ncbi:MAG: hypothetical protein AB1757_06715 [Acidobacteriota bacterium]
MALVKTNGSINEITERLKSESIPPSELGDILMQLAGWYAFYSNKMKKVQLQKAERWLAIKKQGQPKEYSDTRTDMEWETTPLGKQEIALKWELKRIEIMLTGVRSRLYSDQVEAKNQY